MKQLILMLVLLFFPMSAFGQSYDLFWDSEAANEGTIISFTVFQNNVEIIEIPETGTRRLERVELNLTGYDEFWMMARYASGGQSVWWGGPCGGPFLIIDGEPQGDLSWPPAGDPNCPIEEPVEPIDEPVEPIDEPVEPVEPIEEPVEPVEPIEEPVEPVEEPTGKRNAPGQLKKNEDSTDLVDEPMSRIPPGKAKRQ